MTLLEVVRGAWGFTGLKPLAIAASNAFGNVVVEDEDGAFWRICPEELDCRRMAWSRSEFDAVWESIDFQRDWRMDPLVAAATAALGMPAEELCFCLKVPAVLGGAYSVENVGTISRTELLAASGDIARQIADLPDGARLRLKMD